MPNRLPYTPAAAEPPFDGFGLVLVAVLLGLLLTGAARLAGRRAWADRFLAAAGWCLFAGCVLVNVGVVAKPGPGWTPLFAAVEPDAGWFTRAWQSVLADPPVTATRIVTAAALAAFVLYQLRRPARPAGRPATRRHRPRTRAPMIRFRPTLADDIAAATAHVILAGLEGGGTASAADPEQFREVAERVFIALEVYCQLDAERAAPAHSSRNR